jgi:hypothetical protein
LGLDAITWARLLLGYRLVRVPVLVLLRFCALTATRVEVNE